jgi:D-glycero-D-manno-heptose 1,7-bisphosphate phosphatase
MKALFLDRDGVINIDHGYVHRQENFDFMPGIFDFCRQFQEKGFLLFVITNQAGIARRMYTRQDFVKLTSWMITAFETEGITIKEVFYCPHHPSFDIDCDCRKPKPGMIKQACSRYKIDLQQSVLVGDKESDVAAGINAGMSANRCHLFSGDFEEITAVYK